MTGHLAKFRDFVGGFFGGVKIGFAFGLFIFRF